MKIVIKELSEKNIDDHPCFKYGNQTTVEMTKNWLRKVYKKFGSCVKIAYVDEKPVAMVQYAPMDIFPHINKTEAHRTIVIHCIYVQDKKYRGKGIAKKLMQTLIQDLKKPHPYLNGGRFKKIIAVAGKNRPGPAGPVCFFSKMGFTVAKQLSEEDVLMQFQLVPEK